MRLCLRMTQHFVSQNAYPAPASLFLLWKNIFMPKVKYLCKIKAFPPLSEMTANKGAIQSSAQVQ